MTPAAAAKPDGNASDASFRIRIPSYRTVTSAITDDGRSAAIGANRGIGRAIPSRVIDEMPGATRNSAPRTTSVDKKARLGASPATVIVAAGRAFAATCFLNAISIGVLRSTCTGGEPAGSAGACQTAAPSGPSTRRLRGGVEVVRFTLDKVNATGENSV